MWVGAQFLPLVAIYLAVRHGSYVLLASLAGYFAFRWKNKPTKKPHYQQPLARFVHKYPPFRSQQVVMDFDELPKPNSSCMFAYHMHGVLTCGSLINGMAHPMVLKADPLALVGSGLFGICFLSDLLTWYSFAPWTREVMKSEMAKGTNLLLMPGGFEEASCYKRGAHRTYIKGRVGWLKYALQNGYKVYPCYTFGEEFTYWSWTGLMKYRLMINKYQLPGAVFLGRWCTWLPATDLDLTTVMGEPMQLPTIAQPSGADLHKYHALYVERLQALFDKHKKQYARDPAAQLEIVGPSDFGLAK